MIASRNQKFLQKWAEGAKPINVIIYVLFHIKFNGTGKKCFKVRNGSFT